MSKKVQEPGDMFNEAKEKVLAKKAVEMKKKMNEKIKEQKKVFNSKISNLKAKVELAIKGLV